MKYTIDKTAEGAKISFEMPINEWDVHVERAYNKNKSRFNIPGFRKGHAPRHLIEKMYGAGVFLDDAFDYCFRDAYSQALDENPDILPVEEPKVDIQKLDKDGIKFSAEFCVKPEVVLGEYKGLKLDKKEYSVAAKDVENELKRAQERLMRKIETDSEIKDGDIINLNYSGSIDGVKFEGGTAENQELVIGSHTFIPGFEEQLVGMKKGEEKDITVKFPDDYHAEELKGKDAVFAVKVNTVWIKELPPIDDELAKEVSRFETLAEYKDDIKSNLKSANERRAKAENENALIEKIVEGATVNIPECMVTTELEYMLKDFEYQLSYMYQGMKLEDYFKYTGSSKEDYFKGRRSEAERNVKTRLVLEKIVKDEDIKVTDEDMDKEIAQRAESAKKTVEEYRAGIDGRTVEYIRNLILNNKIIDFLTANNTFVKKASKAKEKAAKAE